MILIALKESVNSSIQHVSELMSSVDKFWADQYLTRGISN